MSRPRWTKEDEKKFLKVVKGATSYEDAVARCRAAFPNRALNKDGIHTKLIRLGHPGGIVTVVEANSSRVAKTDASQRVAEFAAVARKGYTLEALCDKLDLSPGKVRQLLDQAKKAGYSIDLAGGHVGYVPPVPQVGVKRVVAQPGEEGIFAVVSDVHVGNKHHKRDDFRDFILRAHGQGVRTILVPGDILDGCYRHSRWEQNRHGFDEQAVECVAAFPKIDGLRYIGITGNHDETFEDSSGLSVVRSLPAVFRDHGRHDFQLIGARGAYLRFAPKGGRGVIIEMWHPRKGPAYAVSYHLQRHVEGYAVGQKPDILLAGHWHQQCYVVRRGVHAFSCGTWQGGHSSYGKSLGGAPEIGGWIIRFKQTTTETVREVSPSWHAYYEREEVREMGLG